MLSYKNGRIPSIASILISKFDWNINCSVSKWCVFAVFQTGCRSSCAGPRVYNSFSQKSFLCFKHSSKCVKNNYEICSLSCYIFIFSIVFLLEVSDGTVLKMLIAAQEAGILNFDSLQTFLSWKICTCKYKSKN